VPRKKQFVDECENCHKKMIESSDGFYIPGPIFGACQTMDDKPILGKSDTDTFLCKECFLAQLEDEVLKSVSE
jgi:hypothetical protein